MAESVKRSSTEEITEHQVEDGDVGEGVGGRQGSGGRALDGGGYLDICTEQSSDSGVGVNYQELRSMGLPRAWLDVAKVTGPRLFLEVWRVLDREELIEHEGRLRMTIPRFRLYLRYQRNRYIQALSAEGYGVSDIQALVEKHLGERISERQIFRLMKG